MGLTDARSVPRLIALSRDNVGFFAGVCPPPRDWRSRVGRKRSAWSLPNKSGRGEIGGAEVWILGSLYGVAKFPLFGGGGDFEDGIYPPGTIGISSSGRTFKLPSRCYGGISYVIRSSRGSHMPLELPFLHRPVLIDE